MRAGLRGFSYWSPRSFPSAKLLQRTNLFPWLFCIFLCVSLCQANTYFFSWRFSESFFGYMEVCSALIFHLAFHGMVPMLLTGLCLSHLLDSFCSSLCYACSSLLVLLALVSFFSSFVLSVQRHLYLCLSCFSRAFMFQLFQSFIS